MYSIHDSNERSITTCSRLDAEISGGSGQFERVCDESEWDSGKRPTHRRQNRNIPFKIVSHFKAIIPVAASKIHVHILEKLEITPRDGPLQPALELEAGHSGPENEKDDNNLI